MRVCIIVLVLIFSLQSLTKADDIRDFQIEGISIGSSLIDYFTKNEINKEKKYRIKYPNSNKFTAITFIEYSKFKIYDSVQANVKTNDKNYIIYSISGINYFKNKIDDCKKISCMNNDLDKNYQCISLGGDHSITYPIIDAYHDYFKNLNILHFDAHPDLYDNFDNNPFSHASPFARILEKKLSKRLIQIGIRTMNKEQQEQVDRFKVQVIDMLNFDPNIKLQFNGPVYISIDLDGLDPAFAPGVSHPEPGGLSTRDILQIISNI